MSAGPSCEPHRMGFGPGAFVLLKRGDEYEEVLLAAPQGPGGTWIARTTTEDGSRFAWVVVHLRLGAFLVPVQAGQGERQCPPGISSDSVNWVCEPPEASHQWRPGGPLLRAVVTEGEAVAHMLGQYGVEAGWSTWPTTCHPSMARASCPLPGAAPGEVRGPLTTPP